MELILKLKLITIKEERRSKTGRRRKIKVEMTRET